MAANGTISDDKNPNAFDVKLHVPEFSGNFLRVMAYLVPSLDVQCGISSSLSSESGPIRDTS